jgi:hypothetical protein
MGLLLVHRTLLLLLLLLHKVPTPAWYFSPAPGIVLKVVLLLLLLLVIVARCSLVAAGSCQVIVDGCRRTAYGSSCPLKLQLTAPQAAQSINPPVRLAATATTNSSSC